MNKFIILDRDGVINYDSDEYIKSPDEWIPIPGSLAAIAKLKQAGYRIAVATNQAGIAYGLYNEATLHSIHQKMQDALARQQAKIDEIFYCPHQAADNCACRKPKPGLLHNIAQHFKISLDNIYFIGDKKSDVDAATAAGCKAVLVRTGYGEQTLTTYPQLAVPIFNDLAAAVDVILQNKLR